MSRFTNSWDTGICDCCDDVKVCCTSWFCHICNVAYQRSATEDRECTCGDCMFVWCYPHGAMVATRGAIRAKYQIEGSCCGDWCTLTFCTVCAIAQQTRQLTGKGATPAGICMD